MRQFKDNASPPRLWTVAINVGAVKRAKTLLAVDLLEISEGEPPLIVRLATDVMLLCDVLYALCQPEAEQRGITDEQFGEAMGGQALFDGQQALMEELADFFHQSDRTEKATVVRQARAMVKATVKAATEKAASIDVEKIATQEVGKRFTESLASLESTPNPSLSAN